MDKRFGENDPRMAPEEKMMERFTREKQLRHKNTSAFDLEDDDLAGELTHMGQSLSLDGPNLKDDFDEEDLELSDAEDHSSDEGRQSRKRLRLNEDSNDEGDDGDDDGGRPERKKSKQEVMNEVIAKSKLYKYERQANKDNDEDLREELDKEMSSIHEMLRGIAPRAKFAPVADLPGMNPDRAALLNGTDKVKFDKEYDMRLKQLAQDARSKPTEPSKTEDQKIEEESRKLKELEEKRLQRMQGVIEDSADEAASEKENKKEDQDEEEEDFGFGTGIKARSSRPTMAELGIDDEDDFLIDDDLVASGSEIEFSDRESAEESSDDEENEVEGANEEDDMGFLSGLLTEAESQRPEFLTGANAPLPELELPANNGVNGDLAYTFKCPETHDELLEVTKGIALLDLPTVVQRIRALYHPKLKSENKPKLRNFAVALVDHISYLADHSGRPPFSVLESLIRHIHSLAKTFPVEIGNAFRTHLEAIHESRALAPTAGDLVLFTAIGSIFPTSDHFHQVVTPAILTMGRYLGQKIPRDLSDYIRGAYLCTLCLRYQKLSKRYIPEVVTFIENTLCALAPIKLTKAPGSFPYHEPKVSVRIKNGTTSPRKVTFYDCVANGLPENDEEGLKIALLETNLSLVGMAADTWTGKAAFTEVFEPVLHIILHLGTKKCRTSFSEISIVSTFYKVCFKSHN
jgi:nucleolar protein 14